MTIARGSSHDSSRIAVTPAIRRASHCRYSESSPQFPRALLRSECLPPLFIFPSLSPPPLPPPLLRSVATLWTAVRAVSAFCIAQPRHGKYGVSPPPYVCACIFGGEQIDRLHRPPRFLAVVGRARPCDSLPADPARTSARRLRV